MMDPRMDPMMDPLGMLMGKDDGSLVAMIR